MDSGSYGDSRRILASLSSDIDPLEDMAASTVAMFIMFGSLTFATVSMMTRAFLSGDKRGNLLFGESIILFFSCKDF